MKKNGYTLIELIALVVILVIAGIIVLSIVLPKIDNSRYESAKSSAYEVISSAKLYHYNKLMNNNGIFNEVTFQCNNTCKYLDEELESYSKPNSGNLTVSIDGTITGELSFYEGDYIFYICNSILYDEKVQNCLPNNNLELKSNDYEEGSEVLYAGLLWNVIKDNGDNTTLVSKNSIGTASLGDKVYNYIESDLNKKLSEFIESNLTLKNAKENDRLINMNFSVFEKDYSNYIRIPSKDEVGISKTNDICSTKWCNIKTQYWLYNYLISTEGIYKVYSINEEGITVGMDVSNELGIRPVITVKEH